jgi:hypothetical protein
MPRISYDGKLWQASPAIDDTAMTGAMRVAFCHSELASYTNQSTSCIFPFFPFWRSTSHRRDNDDRAG